MTESVSGLLWTVGKPVRLALVWLVRGYRASFGLVMGGRCRFYPTCSEYAEAAVTQVGVVRGVSLSVWRVLRCSPLSKGGVDYPPTGRGAGLGAGLSMGEGAPSPAYDGVIHGKVRSDAIERGPG